jgi:hypothetical protein
MLGDILYHVLLFVVGGIGILIFGMIITVVVTIGHEVTTGVFHVMWKHGWFQAVTIIGGITVLLLIMYALS